MPETIRIKRSLFPEYNIRIVELENFEEEPNQLEETIKGISNPEMDDTKNRKRGYKVEMRVYNARNDIVQQRTDLEYKLPERKDIVTPKLIVFPTLDDVAQAIYQTMQNLENDTTTKMGGYNIISSAISNGRRVSRAHTVYFCNGALASTRDEKELSETEFGIITERVKTYFQKE